MSKQPRKTEVVKKNLKQFNDAIKNFNKRLQNANKKGNITQRTYKTLLIDKDKKDFYRENIYTKRQFNKFIKQLEKATSKTLQKSTRQISKIGVELNKLAETRYEKILLKQAVEETNRLSRKGETIYQDIILNVKQENYQKALNRLSKIDIETTGKRERYIENFKRKYKEVFGKSIDEKFKKMTISQIKEIAKIPNMMNLLYEADSDPFASKSETKKRIDELFEEKRAKIMGKDDEDTIDINEL